MDVVAVSERLGHWSPDFTLRVYSHAMPGRQADVGPYHRGGAWLVFLHDSYKRLPWEAASIAFPQVGAHRGGSSVG